MSVTSSTRTSVRKIIVGVAVVVASDCAAPFQTRAADEPVTTRARRPTTRAAAAVQGPKQPPPAPAVAAAAVARRSSDGVEYGDPLPTPVRFPTLPLVNEALGNSPESLAGRTPVYERTRSPVLVAAILRDVKLVGPDGEEPHRSFQFYFTPGAASAGGANAIGFDVDGGRVVRIGVIWRRLTPRQQDLHAERLAKASEGAAPDAARAAAARFAGVGVGGKVPVEVHLVRNAEAQGTSAMIVVQADPVEWYVAHNETPAEIAVAMREKRLLVGMTERQADLAMRDLKKWLAQETATTKQVVWLEKIKPVGIAPHPPARFSAMFHKGKITDVRYH